VDGISLASLITEVSCYAGMTAYAIRKGYACFLWGSEAACYLQDSFLIAMVVVLRRLPRLQVACAAAVWLGAQALLFTEAVPMWLLSKFQIATALLLGLGARVPQILLNFRRGHTGTLTAATSIFNATANVVTFMVVSILTQDRYVLFTQCWMFMLNITIIGQIAMSRRRESVRAACKLHGKQQVQRVSYDADKYQRGMGYA
jgi:PQ loop repeat